MPYYKLRLAVNMRGAKHSLAANIKAKIYFLNMI